MDTRKITKEFRLAHWAQIARERAESGKNVRDYCRQIGVHENTYYHWQRRLREASISGQLATVRDAPRNELAPSGWTSIAESEVAAPLEPPSLPIEIGKFKVTVNTGTDAELLARTLKTLAELC